MNSATVAALLHCFLLADLIQSAPVNLLGDEAQLAITLVEKIRKNVRAVHDATVTNEGLTLDSSTQTSNLLMMVASLGIPAAPVLKLPSEDFTLDVCVSRMSAGVRLYQRLLGDLSGRLSGLDGLRADLRDLLTHITKMKEAAQLGGSAGQNQSVDLASRLLGGYEVQVAANATLKQLLAFCHDMMRSLRAIDTYRRAAGTR